MKAAAFVALGLLTAGFIDPILVIAQNGDIKITVDEKGFNPPIVTVVKGERARLVFMRTTDETCARKVVIPSLKISEDLPLNKPVAIDIRPEKSATIGFVCPMEMLKGRIEVK